MWGSSWRRRPTAAPSTEVAEEVRPRLRHGLIVELGGRADASSGCCRRSTSRPRCSTWHWTSCRGHPGLHRRGTRRGRLTAPSRQRPRTTRWPFRVCGAGLSSAPTPPHHTPVPAARRFSHMCGDTTMCAVRLNVCVVPRCGTRRLAVALRSSIAGAFCSSSSMRSAGPVRPRRPRAAGPRGRAVGPADGVVCRHRAGVRRLGGRRAGLALARHGVEPGRRPAGPARCASPAHGTGRARRGNGRAGAGSRSAAAGRGPAWKPRVGGWRHGGWLCAIRYASALATCAGQLAAVTAVRRRGRSSPAASLPATARRPPTRSR